MKQRILIIDDSSKLRGLLDEYLTMAGMEVFSLENGNDVLETISSFQPDVVILDIIMPGKDGYSVLKEIRRRHTLPVIMLTARGDDVDKIVGLELGANDYISKPFNSRELEARIKAVIRTYCNGKVKSRLEYNREPATVGHNIFHVNDFVLKFNDHKISFKGRKKRLSAMEFKIMAALMKTPGKIFTRDELITICSGPDIAVYDRSIDAHVSRIRTKIKAIGGKSNTIKTIHGVGYRFVDKDD